MTRIKASIFGITAYVQIGETPCDALVRKIKKVHGEAYGLHMDSFNQGSNSSYRVFQLCSRCKSGGTDLHGGRESIACGHLEHNERRTEGK